MSLKVITAPSEIITVSEAADFMRVDFPDDEESIISAMITSARQWCEEYLRRAIGVQTLETILPCFPQRGRKEILLRPPVISVTSVKYLDTSGVEQTLVLNTEYRLSIDSDPAEIVPVDNAWPACLDVANAVRVRYQTGYYGGGSPAESIELPKTIRTAILMQVADLYHNRESQVEKPLSSNPTLERMLSMYRLEMGI